MFEVAQILVGKKGREWWQQRDNATFPIPVVVVLVSGRTLDVTDHLPSWNAFVAAWRR